MNGGGVYLYETIPSQQYGYTLGFSWQKVIVNYE